MMIGTWINVAAILVGGTLGLVLTKELSGQVQHRIRMVLGVMIIYVGLMTTWDALRAPFTHFLKQLVVIFFALILGNLIGRALKLQARLNKVGEVAREKFSQAQSDPESARKFSEGFVTCTLLFCVGPMAILGSLQDGLTGNIKTLASKALLDGLASLVFARTFGWSVLLSALPVLAYQGTLTMSAQVIKPWVDHPELVSSINATGGLLVVCISMVVLEVQRVPLANYVPSLLVAPLLSYWMF